MPRAILSFFSFVSALVLAGALAPCQARADGRFAAEGAQIDVGVWGYDASVAVDGSFGFVVAWRDGLRVYARRYDAQGQPRGAALVVHEGATTQKPSVACGRAGSFVVAFAVWAGNRTSIGYAAYAADGAPLGHGWIAETPSFVGYAVNVTADVDGNFVVRWHDWQPAGIANWAQFFDAQGAPRSAILRVNGSGQGNDFAPTAYDGRGRALLVWDEGDTCLARHYDAWGNPLDEPVDLAIPYCHNACSDKNGEFVVAWGWAFSIFVRRFDADGRPLGPITPVNELQTPAGLAPIACTDEGAFALAWTYQGMDDRLREVHARRFAADGTPDSPEFRVNAASPGVQREPGIGADPSGNFVVAWSEYLGHDGVYAQRFRVAPPPRVKGDFDGDGHADLVLRRVSDGRVRVWTLREGVRAQNLAVWPNTPGWDWRLGGVDDFNGDGHADLLFRHQATGQVDIWLLGGSSGTARIGSATFTDTPLPSTNWIVAATADFDGDGKADVLWRNTVTQKIAVWLLDGTRWRATRFPSPDQGEDASWVAVGAGDFDGDGLGDILWYNTASGRLVQWLFDASLVRRLGRFTNPADAGGATWNVGAVADYGFGTLGQAGTLDVVWRSDESGEFRLWFMDRDGVSTSSMATVPAVPSEPLEWTLVGPR